MRYTLVTEIFVNTSNALVVSMLHIETCCTSFGKRERKRERERYRGREKEKKRERERERE
jgi:hypothetical protein